MIGAQEAGEDDADMQGDDAKGDPEPPIENKLFEIEVGMLAARKGTPGVAGLADGGLYEGAEVTATL
jgi:hypothetical protein